ncbi:MAG: M23 family metallopeptidase [Deltaproteobacteria bacterium]|nr:M23 family metallopeptidase [Deltaproteobacteria bacterium]
MSRRVLFLAALGLVATVSPRASAADFTYRPPGELVSGSGKGRVDTKVYAPGMRFPIEVAPAYANSQVWGAGGMNGPGGTQCSTSNYSYPWRDNYCETRSWDMPLCPAGTGHQGQDIRASTCAKDVHWAVATTDGTITNIGSYSVYLTAADGTRYDYLHMSNVAVSLGAKVKRGQRLGKVSNVFGSTPTTIHLHFNMRQNVTGVGSVYVPPYLSLVESYKSLIGPPPDVNDPPKGQLDSASCDVVRGWAQDPDVADKPIPVRLYIDGKVGDAGATVLNLTASEKRDDLCGPLGSCEHAFSTPVPLSFLDGRAHEVRALAMDSAGGANTELPGGPKTITCVTVIPDGVLRHVPDPKTYASWSFDPIWHQVAVDDAKLAGREKGVDLPPVPRLVKGDDGAPEVWLIDGGLRRHVPNPDVLVAWSFDGTTIETMAAAEIAALPKGPVVRNAPFLVKGSGPEVWLVDDAFPKTTGGTAPDAAIGDDDASVPAADAVADMEGSCACRSAPAAEGATRSLGASFAALAIVVVVTRRRSSRRERQRA